MHIQKMLKYAVNHVGAWEAFYRKVYYDIVLGGCVVTLWDLIWTKFGIDIVQTLDKVWICCPNSVQSTTTVNHTPRINKV